MGALIGIATAGGLALPSILAPAFAEDEPLREMVEQATEPVATATVIRGGDFVKPQWVAGYGSDIVEPWVATEATEVRTVRKITFGKTEFVSIATTNTGVYSSDALDSPHVRYPGIHRTERTRWGMVMIWDGGWQAIQPLSANSLIMSVPFPGGRTVITDDGICIRTRHGLYC